MKAATGRLLAVPDETYTRAGNYRIHYSGRGGTRNVVTVCKYVSFVAQRGQSINLKRNHINQRREHQV
ncbi:hypothetical protein E2C01_041870 [Portunus trituberculatus]|uniref:Uncharacterized protein n=1 Tax=Portunus trituberculatus TaxID=210409 RepID=A0A5B7FRU3_PORTR|nr:hypothetical protein [Portunus trituberculatus]